MTQRGAIAEVRAHDVSGHPLPGGPCRVPGQRTYVMVRRQETGHLAAHGAGRPGDHDTHAPRLAEGAIGVQLTVGAQGFLDVIRPQVPFTHET